MNENQNLSLYLHIPFCRHRCSYCDFNTYTSVGDLKAAYATALCAEVGQVGGDGGRPAHTVYLGGGTPSLMPTPALAHILGAVNDHFSVTAAAEISLEANPGTVDAATLGTIRELGVNRLSFGVQSAIPGELALLGREHDFPEAIAAVEMSRAAGFENINLDLIYGLPGQTLVTWEESLKATLALKPTHLSLYCLTIEPGTPMGTWQKDGRFPPPNPDLAADQYELACSLLAEHGFEHYEISNWALPGYSCRHNLAYWRNQSYLGLGAGAHGHAGGFRYRVVKQPRVYIRRLRQGKPEHYPLSTAVAEKHRIGRNEAMADTVITQLRLLQEGLDLDAFARRFGQTLDEVYEGTAGQLIKWGLLWAENGRLRLTEKGRFLSNQVFYRFI